MDQHEMIQALKELSLELGRTPTRSEFVNSIPGGGHRVERLFRNYSLLLKAAGIETYNERRKPKPLGNEIFEASVSDRVEKFEPRPSIQSTGFDLTLILGDTHFPFESSRVLGKVYDWAEKNQPKRIIQIGDLYDMYGWSKFPKSVNLYTPKEEEQLARKKAEEMWATLQKLCPNAECIQIKGNHDIRPMKQTLAHLPSLEQVVGRYLDDLMTFQGVTLIKDERQEYVAQDVSFIHGYRGGLGAHRDYMLGHVVCGHTHLGGVTFRRIRGQTLWELNAGLIGDPESKALSYTPQKTVNWTPGFGVIFSFGPAFISV